MGESPDGDAIDTGLGDSGDGAEVHPAAGLEEGAGGEFVPQSDGPDKLLVRHVVEENLVDAPEPEEDFDLVEAVGFELDEDVWMLVPDFGETGGEIDGIGVRDEVVVLHHDGVVETHPVVRAAPMDDGGFLQFPPSRGRLPGVEETGAGADHPFSGEKLSLVLTCYKYETFDDAIAQVNAITGYSGSGHSCGIHSNDDARILRLGLETKTSRVIVRQPHGVANSGSWSNGLAKTFSLGCGSWGGNSVSENVTQKHYYNTTRIARPLDRSAPDDAAIYGPLLGKIAAVRIEAGA